MKIELAQHSGFCIGVRDAVLKIVKNLNDTDEEIYVYGPLIHNPQTTEILEKRGLKTIKSLDHIDGKIIAIRTHGIPVENLRDIKKRAKRYIDLTCPRVSKVQGLIKKYSGKGYFTIIIGDADHAEVLGLKSYAASGVVVISKTGDIDGIPSAERYIIVSQTTQDSERFNTIVDSIRKKYPDVLVFNTICDSTHLRQDEIRAGISRNIGALIVVGGRDSANTARLVRLGYECGVRTFHIESEKELSPEDFSGIDYVLVTAGASTPGWIINNVMEKLYSIRNSRKGLPATILFKLAEYALRLNLLSAVSAFFINMVVQRYLGAAPDIIAACISGMYIFSMYTINNSMEMDTLLTRNPLKYRLQNEYRSILMPASVVTLIASIVLMFQYGYMLFVVYLLSVLLGCVYSGSMVKRLVHAVNIRLFTRLYYLKNLVSSLGWVLSAAIIPVAIHRADPWSAAALCMLVFTLTFTRDLLIDMIALQGDLLFGRQTLPTFIGTGKTRLIAVILSAVTLALFASVTVWRGNYYYLLFMLNCIYFLFIYMDTGSRNYSIQLRQEMLLDANAVLLIALYFITSSLG